MSDSRDLQAGPFNRGRPAHTVRRYAAWRVGGPIRAVSELAWRMEAADAAEPAQLVLPHGEPSLAIRVEDGQARLGVCAPARSMRVYAPRPGTRILALQLSPECAAEIADIDPVALPDHEWVDAPAWIERAARPMLDRIGDTSSDAGLAVFFDWFTQLASHRRATRPALSDTPSRPEAQAAALIRRTGGRLAIADLASRTGMSERQLRRRFRDRLGLSPKAYARQVRLARTIAAADQVGTPDWAGLAVERGYFDQAHLIAETRALTGLTPEQIVARRAACPKSPIPA